MTTINGSTQRRFWQIFGRSQQWLRISGYHAGDIHSDKPVTITVGSTMKGDVIAPRVVVDGTLDGSVVTQSLEVRKDGQVLGNVHACQIVASSGGKLLGWVKSLDEAAYALIQEKGHLPNEQEGELHGLPKALEEIPNSANGHGPINLLAQLRAEAASAISARAELEQAFERRINEIAGESSARVERLTKELEGSRQQLSGIQERAKSISETLSARDQQVEKQVAEIDLSRKMLAQQQDELEGLRGTSAEQRGQLEKLGEENEAMETAVLQANRDAEAALDRFNSIKTTLQDNLQHTAELEESLLRWQELAEVTETKAKGLETELQTVKLQLEESSQMNNLLRDQRKAAEEALETAVVDLQAVKDSQSAETDPEAIAALQARIATLEQEAAQQHERLLWAKANAEKGEGAEEALQQAKAGMEDAQAENGRLSDQLNEQKLQLKAYENEIERYNEEIGKQGERMADIYGLLAERDEQLAGTSHQIDKLNEGVRQFQDKAKNHIEKLNRQLAQARQRTKKLEAYIQQQKS